MKKKECRFCSSLYLFVLFFLCIADVNAETQVSILTSTPSPAAVYTLWGHTAIRVKTDSTDNVYNYGVFMFDEGFVYKFVKGETDYWVEHEPYASARSIAVYKNVYLYEQVLNLTEEQAVGIARALLENEKHENRFYRYNYFYDNCATRVRDIVERYSNIAYPPIQNTTTYRDEIHSLVSENPWLSFGIDLCLGSKADEIVDGRALMFLPCKMMQIFDEARLENGENIVKEKKKLVVPIMYDAVETVAITPSVVAWMLFFLILAYTLMQLRVNSSNVIFDCVMFIAYGLLGTLIAFLVFVSEHPCTSPNFHLLWTNPLQLTMPYLLFRGKDAQSVLKIIGAFLFTCCVVMLVSWPIIPQKYDYAVLPLVLLMALRLFYLLYIVVNDKFGGCTSKKFFKKETTKKKISKFA